MGQPHHLNPRQKKPLAKQMRKANRTKTRREWFKRALTTFRASGLARPFSERVNHPLAEKVRCGKIAPQSSLKNHCTPFKPQTSWAQLSGETQKQQKLHQNLRELEAAGGNPGEQSGSMVFSADTQQHVLGAGARGRLLGSATDQTAAPQSGTAPEHIAPPGAVRSPLPSRDNSTFQSLNSLCTGHPPESLQCSGRACRHLG